MYLLSRHIRFRPFLIIFLMSAVFMASIFSPLHRNAGVFISEKSGSVSGRADLRASGTCTSLPEAVKEDHTSLFELLSGSLYSFSSRSGFRNLISLDSIFSNELLLSAAKMSIRTLAPSHALILLNPATFSHRYTLSYIQAQLYS